MKAVLYMLNFRAFSMNLKSCKAYGNIDPNKQFKMLIRDYMLMFWTRSFLTVRAKLTILCLTFLFNFFNFVVREVLLINSS